MKGFFKWLANQRGSFGIGAILVAVVMVVLVGTAIVALWPTVQSTATSVAGLTQTDAGTTVLKGLWPLVALVLGAGAAAGLIVWALKEFGLIG